jgi:hypothetical protein
MNVGEPIRSRASVGPFITRGALAVAPLLEQRPNRAKTVLFDAALERGFVEVTELEGGGAVPLLRIRNRGELPVLVPEGQQLQGGRQDRVVNASLLVPAATDMDVPVSCVERGRWAHRSRSFGSSYRVAPSVRSVLRGSVSDSLSTGRGYTSDQRAVWRSVDDTLDHTGVSSSTSSLSDSYVAHMERLRGLGTEIPALPDQVGVVVAVEGRPLALELFPDAESYARVHATTLASYAFAAEHERVTPRLSDVDALLRALDGLTPTRSPSVGLGEDVRADTEDVSFAGLELDGEVLHACALAREAPA